MNWYEYGGMGIAIIGIFITAVLVCTGVEKANNAHDVIDQCVKTNFVVKGSGRTRNMLRVYDCSELDKKLLKSIW